MRYLMTTGQNSRPADKALFADMGAFIQEMTAAGILVATGGLEPGGTRLRSQGDEVTVTDGPFVEAKEEILGFALVEVSSHEEALEVARRFRLIVGDGDSMLHRVSGP
jgi:hypothetical protein